MQLCIGAVGAPVVDDDDFISQWSVKDVLDLVHQRPDVIDLVKNGDHDGEIHRALLPFIESPEAYVKAREIDVVRRLRFRYIESPLCAGAATQLTLYSEGPTKALAQPDCDGKP
jgi:hypothetical protein